MRGRQRSRSIPGKHSIAVGSGLDGLWCSVLVEIAQDTNKGVRLDVALHAVESIPAISTAVGDVVRRCNRLGTIRLAANTSLPNPFCPSTSF